MKKAILTVVLTIALIVAAGYGVNYLKAKPGAPSDFTAARQQSTETASQIGGLINSSVQNLASIQREDLNGNYAKALTLVSEELVRAKESQRLTVNLATQIEQMAKTVGGVKPDNARQFALEATTTGTSMVSHLISYSTYYAEFLTSLSAKFEGDTSASSPAKLKEIIGKINEEAKTINDLNKQLNTSFQNLDTVLSDK
jgi:hypothetical protein